ncbi:NAD(P)/FAD-dependent oxidoreductase [Telmatospirillum siberiense]|uniref:FAD-dependent oxidoreductase n=1 Tax=Telmatospirillum siberiense TaxID=382514 RepID=A0A2N3PZQ9_9PROT|nr:NAD(P)/FAD-dependent oxidoreductase [Telmatospirillum siberiense]PKU25892.1 FAD-dependent oxidoreductase [Telmatospirillum siberiense]
MTERLDCAVIGAGVIGLAIARALALAGHEVIVLEAEDAIGTGTSSRNSEVLHAGMYYPAGSLKARLCVKGNAMLRGYLAERRVDHKMLGKLIVATDTEEEAQLDAILAKGQTNGVERLNRLSAAQAHALEPAVRCTAALHSPLTGIIDTHGYMLVLQGDIEAAGGIVALKSPVLRGEISDKGILLSVGGDEPSQVLCGRVVNAGGLGAQAIGASFAGLSPETVPPLYLCKGNYFLLGGRVPFSRLVYPTPQSAGLGVHFTLDLAGQGRFGPDVEWVDEAHYEVDARRGDGFYAAIRRYWPDLKDDALRPGFAGIRTKLKPQGQTASDFLIQGPADHGVDGLVNLYGMESPGLTASLAIGAHVAELLQ